MLVTGGSGFIGTNLLNLVDGESFDLLDGKDIRNQSDVSRIDSSVIVHLAAIPGVTESIKDPRATHLTNVDGFYNILEHARFKNAKVIFASSAAADNCNTPYAVSKRIGELYCRSYNLNYGLQYIALRFGNVYGPHSLFKNSVVATMCKDALLKGKITVNGECYRDFIHVYDVVEAIVSSIHSGVNGVLNVGTGTPTPVNKIAEIISNETGAEIIYKGTRKGDVTTSVLDITDTLNHLNWRPDVELEEGIRSTLEWFKRELTDYEI